jgi:hypothetical protein
MYVGVLIYPRSANIAIHAVFFVVNVVLATSEAYLHTLAVSMIRMRILTGSPIGTRLTCHVILEDEDSIVS